MRKIQFEKHERDYLVWICFILSLNLKPFALGNFLFRMDLDVNHADKFGTTALMYASKQQPGESVVKLLLERKDLELLVQAGSVDWGETAEGEE